jgi:hypothetical protein
MAAAQSLGVDEQKLADLGYKQELTRGWSRFSNLAIWFTYSGLVGTGPAAAPSSA